MRTWSLQRKNAQGFTLVELLVVIAIIGILAGIVVPQVAQYIRRSKVARAHSEIRNADSSLSAMLADAKRSSFRHFLNEHGRAHLGAIPAMTVPGNLDALKAAQGFYNEMFYELLRRGKQAELYRFSPLTNQDEFVFEREVIDKLSSSYMDLVTDPWGHQYNFWLGPYQPSQPVLHRSYRGPGFVYNNAARAELQSKVPGNPASDDLAGMPAPRNMPVYIYSSGQNELLDASLVAQSIYNPGADFIGGGDDINNWDSEAGWDEAPQT